MNTSNLITSVLFGAIGSGYFLYGWRQKHGMALLAGAGLCLAPYFITSTVILILVCLGLMVLPFFLGS
ncbi:MAG: hypothetical protein A3K19_12525 [Lentisphaerae bacterium RIFOXYB12_FULL_65_16]|nr:MAG: hypothetical protein A3K18_12150 [Lentisphaerae bacterium RIFOXYA12_64_32]OGV88108.1 MAG: hypothetical protein A3K19_12525 [Lentisphaerae bacterium RIFOXYB12_FULL_65_16]